MIQLGFAASHRDLAAGQRIQGDCMTVSTASLATRFLACASALFIAGQPATAQTFNAYPLSDFDGPRTQAEVFLRIPLGAGPSSKQAARFGLALSSACSTSLAFSSARASDACSTAPFRSVELSNSFGADWTLSLGGAGLRTDLASWSSDTGALTLADGEKGSSGWLWIALGLGAGVAVLAALSADDDTHLCPDNTIPNPLTGACEPLQLN